MIDVTNNRTKQLLLRELTLMQMKLERTLAMSVARILRSQFNQAAKLIGSGRKGDVFLAVDSKTKDLEDVFRARYRRTASVFFDRLMGDVEKSIMAYDSKSVISDFWESMNKFILSQSMLKARTINMATKKVFQTILDKSLAEGLSYENVAKRFRETGRVHSVWRSRRIARTEGHTSMAKSLNEAANATGMVRTKEWVSANDNRTRTSPFDHVGANGETVGFDDMYQATGEAMAHPGDPNGSAGNVVNCRCIELYHTMIKMVLRARKQILLRRVA